MDLSNFDGDLDATTLVSFMDRMLETLVNVYDSYGVDLPLRRYWMSGEPAIDCEQAVISFVQVYLGRPGDEAAEPRRCDEPKSVVLSIQISRPTPTPKEGRGGTNPPTAEDIQAAAQAQMVDCWILMDAVDQFDVTEHGTPGIGVIATVEAGEVSGGFASVTMSLTLSVM